MITIANKVIALINPNATKAKKAIRFCKSRSLAYHILLDASNCLSLLQRYASGNGATFLVFGGDGTYNAFTNALFSLTKRQRDTCYAGFLPCGRANDLPAALGIPNSLPSAYDRILAGEIRKIDVLKVNKHFFLSGGGFGLPAEVVKTHHTLAASTFHQKVLLPLGNLSYLAVTLAKMMEARAWVDIKCGHETHPERLMLCAIMNQPFIGKRFLLCPPAKQSDGLLDVVSIPKQPTRAANFGILLKVLKGTHLRNREVKHVQAREITITTTKQATFMADGELLCSGTAFKFTCHRNAIRILC